MVVSRFFHLAAAAFFAIRRRWTGDNFNARASPPFDAPSAESACACGFLFTDGLRISPTDSSTTRRAFCMESARLPPLLARVGMDDMMPYSHGVRLEGCLGSSDHNESGRLSSAAARRSDQVV